MTAVATAKNNVIRVIQPGSCDILLDQNGQDLRGIRVGYIYRNRYVPLKQLSD